MNQIRIEVKLTNVEWKERRTREKNWVKERKRMMLRVVERNEKGKVEG